LQTYTEHKDVEKILDDIKSFMQKATKKKQSFTSRQISSIPLTLGYALPQCRLAFLLHPKAFDLLIDFAPKIEAYRGKGTQPLNDALPRTLQAIISEVEYGSAPTPSYSEENKMAVFSKMAAFSLTRARGNGKAVRSNRTAKMRYDYWTILSDLAEELILPDALALAKVTALNERTTLPEREGAIEFLLTELGCQNSSNDPEVTSIIEKLRAKPCSRDIHFRILNHFVDSGELDKMSALFELEEFD